MNSDSARPRVFAMRARWYWLGVVIWAVWVGAVYGQGRMPASARGTNAGKLPLPADLDTLPANARDAVSRVMQSPTITAIAPAEEFCTTGEMYLWLLDHPDRVSLAWQRLKVGAVDICPIDGGRFRWQDDQGSELTWRTVIKNGEGRIWYAEGKVKPGALLPVVPVRAVAVLRHGVKKDEAGESVIRHQVEVFLQTDSRAANLVMRLVGPTVPRMAQDGAEQLLAFFSGIARYVDKHPTKAAGLLAEKK
jgi:hypothetical protein